MKTFEVLVTRWKIEEVTCFRADVTDRGELLFFGCSAELGGTHVVAGFRAGNWISFRETYDSFMDDDDDDPAISATAKEEPES